MHWHIVWKIKQIERQGAFTRLFIFCLPPRSTRYNNGNEQRRAFEKDLCLWQVKGQEEAQEMMYSDLTKPPTWHEWEGRQTHSSVAECKKEMLQGSFHKHYMAKLQLDLWAQVVSCQPYSLQYLVGFFLGQPPTRRFSVKQGHNSAPAPISVQASILLAHDMAQQ